MARRERDELFPVLVMDDASDRAECVDLPSRYFEEGPIVVSWQSFNDDELHTELGCNGLGLLKYDRDVGIPSSSIPSRLALGTTSSRSSIRFDVSDPSGA